MPLPLVLAIDQGTTSTRAIVCDAAGRVRGSAARPIEQHFPRPGWVEHDPEEIWRSVLTAIPAALAAANAAPADIVAIGITNQRETIVVWERVDGKPCANAIVWQDRRTAEFCRERHADEPWLTERTGLVLDPYFSATKLRWLLDRDPALRTAAEAGRLACGTIDAFLLWRLTGGRRHCTDRTNASRTLLLNLHTAEWDADLCRWFDVPPALLPAVKPSCADFGFTAGLDILPDGVPIVGVAGDQQAALFGQCAFRAGEAKCTYGTGAFFLQHLGARATLSCHRLLTTIAASGVGPPHYALEGSVFVAGAAVQWLRDGLHLIDEAAAIEALAQRSDPEQSLILVPGFVGLGAPHWIPEVRGVLFGITRGTSVEDLARATLEGVAFQVADLIEAAAKDAGQPLNELRVDGGMAANAWFMQCQANILGLPVAVSHDREATARGAAYLAGLHVGVWSSEDQLRQLAADAPRFNPNLAEKERTSRLAQWRRAVQTAIAFYAK